MLVSIKGGIILLNFLIHHTEVEIDAGNLWVILANSSMHDGQSFVHIVEAFREVPTIEVVHGKCGVVEAYMWVI